MKRRTFLRAAIAASLVAVPGVCMASTYRFTIERHARRLVGLAEPLRVVFMSDLHFGPYIREASVASWVDATLAQRPDLILLGGDLVDRHVADDVGPLVTQLARLRAPLGVWAVWGNHDRVAFGSGGTFRAALADAGVRVLVNEAVRPRDDLLLAGIDDLVEGRPDLGAALAEAPGHGATLLLSHNPDVLPRVPTHVGLTLAGHTHGGQICLPGGVPIYTASRYGRRFARGWVEGPARGYVSRGLGVSLLPIRFACPAELTVLDLAP